MYRRLIVSGLLLCSWGARVLADPIPVRHAQGTYHGFLTLHTLDGKTIAMGDLVQVAHGDRVTSRLTFHFKDGSLDDETTIFTQSRTFQLVSDHHVQRGPSFPKPIDALVEANGNVTMREGEGKDAKVTTEHMDLPPDTYNGLEYTALMNISTKTPETKVAFVAPTGKGRVVHISIKPGGEDEFVVGYVRRKATNYLVHIEIGGIAGVVAPVVGKEPKDAHVWVIDGVAPAVAMAEGQMYEGGPVWRIETVSAVPAGAR